MSWLSKWWRGVSVVEDGTSQSNTGVVLAQLALALADGKVSQKELQAILVKVGLGVVNAGLPGQLQRMYSLTDPEAMRRLADKNVDLALAEVSKVHVLLGELLEGVK